MTRPVDGALRAALEAADGAYRRARARGDPDPVVTVTRTDPGDPERFEVSVCPRAALIASPPLGSRDVAQALREGAGSEGLLTIVVRTWNGVSVIDRHPPRGPAPPSK